MRSPRPPSACRSPALGRDGLAGPGCEPRSAGPAVITQTNDKAAGRTLTPGELSPSRDLTAPPRARRHRAAPRSGPAAPRVPQREAKWVSAAAHRLPRGGEGRDGTSRCSALRSSRGGTSSLPSAAAEGRAPASGGGASSRKEAAGPSAEASAGAAAGGRGGAQGVAPRGAGGGPRWSPLRGGEGRELGGFTRAEEAAGRPECGLSALPGGQEERDRPLRGLRGQRRLGGLR